MQVHGTPPLGSGPTMHPPPPAQRRQKGRDWRGRLMEETMLPLTTDELLYVTRDELCGLSTKLEWILAGLESRTTARLSVLVSLDSVRRTMLRRRLHF